MGLGTSRSENRIYLSVGFGKIRQKTMENGVRVTAETPNAVKRTTQQGGDTWALEFDFIEGIIENIFYKEDANYGNSFEVIIRDALDLYQISFPDDSRFWFDLMKRLPNVKLTEKLKIKTFDFKDKDGKRIAGLRIEQNGVQTPSYYDEKQNDKWVLLHGYPTAEGLNWKDKDELKIYLINVKKFLKNQFSQLILPKFGEKEHTETHVAEQEPIPPIEEDDLPF